MALLQQKGLFMSAVLMGVLCSSAEKEDKPAEAGEKAEAGPANPIRRRGRDEFSEKALRARLSEARNLLKKLDPSKVKAAENGVPILWVEGESIDALHFVRGCRNADAVPLLVPFLDVRFLWIVDAPINAQPRSEIAADKALKEIGLPSVDYILKQVSDGKLDKDKRKPARELCLEILGDEGLQARAAFLKLAKNDKVKAFLDGK